MNKLSSILGIAIISLICACTNKPVATKQNVIVGTWKLQTQQTITYINNALQVNTYSIATSTPQPTITFSSNGADTVSAAFGFINNGFGYGIVPFSKTGEAGSIGTYTIAGDTLLTMKPFFIGTLYTDTMFVPAKAIVFSNKIVSEIAIVKELNSSVFTLETDIDVLQTADNKTRTITKKTIYSYTR